MMNYDYTRPTQNPLDEIRRFFKQGSALALIILVNVGIWVLVQVLKVIFFFYNSPESSALDLFLMHALAIPASLPDLAARPWTLFTYMFLHFDIWHILFNMLWLYWFGRIFLEFLPSRLMVLTYVLGGLGGGLFYVFAFNVFPVFASIVPVSYALGASASVMAIVAAVSVYVPNYTIQLFLIGKLRIIYLAIILFIFDFIMIPSGNAGGHLAHIGGAILGTVIIMIYRISKTNVQQPGASDFIRNLINLFRKAPDRGRTNGGYSGRPVSDEEFNLKKKQTQKKVDEILEKISKGGYDCLTKEEKEFLFKTSNKR